MNYHNIHNLARTNVYKLSEREVGKKLLYLTTSKSTFSNMKYAVTGKG